MKHQVLNCILFLVTIYSFSFPCHSQGFDNQTRALYILDISRYVEWPNDIFLKNEFFTVGVLDPDEDLFREIENIGRTRKYIQGKPLQVHIFKRNEDLQTSRVPLNVLYVNKKNYPRLDPILRIITGRHILLFSEGYEFRESMFNFVAVAGKPNFEINEELLNKEGLKVSKTFLALAVKTREDWEKLFQVTDTMLQVEKELTQQQKVIIAEQDIKIRQQADLIREQMVRLDSLDREIGKKQITILQKEKILMNQEKEIGQQRGIIQEQVKQVSDQKKNIEAREGEIAELEKERASKESVIKQQDARINEQLKEIEKQKLITYFVVVALILVSGIGYFIYINYRNKKKANEILEGKNRLITAQKDEIKQQKEIAEMQRDQIAYQKKHITDSIHYALRIQKAILPSLELFSDEIEHFVLYKPMDIVSGDFYWVNKRDHRWIVIASDCTGHGVPGAFMSMLGISFLNEIVINRNITRPDLILNALRDNVINSLKQYDIQSDVKDGMDITVCAIDYSSSTLEFAGANNPLFLVQRGELIHVKGDKMPVAVHADMQPFTLNTFTVEKGDSFYTFSDGFVDQFGGPNQKKFLTRNFKDAIMSMQDKPMYEQGMALDKIFEDWRKEVDQVDDVTLIGIRY